MSTIAYATTDYKVQLDPARKIRGVTGRVVDIPAGHYVYGVRTGIKVGSVGLPFDSLDKAIRVCDDAQARFDEDRESNIARAEQAARYHAAADHGTAAEREALRAGRGHGVDAQIWDNA